MVDQQDTMRNYRSAAMLLMALTVRAAERPYVTERSRQINGHSAGSGPAIVSGRSSTGATFVHDPMGHAILRFPDGTEQRLFTNVMKKITFFRTPAEALEVELAPESDCMKNGDGSPALFATLAGREKLLGVDTVRILDVTPSARAVSWRVPGAGCVLVQMGVEWLDPATGRMGSVTTERMTKFEFKEPEVKWFASTGYEEVTPSAAQQAEIFFNTRGRGPKQPLDDKIVEIMERADANYKRRNPNGRTRNGL